MPAPFSTIEAAVAAIARGEVVIVVDAEDRENEGDFIAAAERVTPEIINFMLTHGRGQVCMPVLPDICERLKLPPMVERNTAPLGTAFTVPVDHRSCKTGITAPERARTIQAIIDPKSQPADFVRPGHLFPLMAKEGGVLRRAGHTEAAIDLARLAGLTPAGVLCEILDADGNRATRDDLFALARRFGLEIISIEELIRYRRQREKLVYRLAEASLPTRYGMGRVIAYGVKYETQQPLVLVLHDDSRALAPLHRFIEGYEFALAETTTRAREICEETPPAAVVMDSSWTVHPSALCEPLGLPPDIPQVTCPLPSLRRLAADLGAVDVLTKPVTREDLAQALARLNGPLRRVLIVDDDAHMVRLLARMVRAGNPSLEVFEAFDGREGLQVARAQRPDLLFLDLAMPNMADGYALLHEIRQDETLAGTRVIVVSAHAMEEGSPPMAGEVRLRREAGFSLTDVLQALQALLPVVTRPAAMRPATVAAPAPDRPG